MSNAHARRLVLPLLSVAAALPVGFVARSAHGQATPPPGAGPGPTTTTSTTAAEPPPADPAPAWPGTTPSAPPVEGTTTTQSEPARPLAPAELAPVRWAPAPPTFQEAYRREPEEPSGLDAVVEMWGLSLMRGDSVANPRFDGTDRSEAVPLPTLGFRYWLNGRYGIDAGIAGVFLAPDAATPTIWGLGPAFGVPIALSQWRYLTTYIKPQASAYFVHFGRSTNRFQMALSGLAGAEIYLGFLDLPAVALSFETGVEYAFFGGRTPEGTASDGTSSGGPYTGSSVTMVPPLTLDDVPARLAVRVYF